MNSIELTTFSYIDPMSGSILLQIALSAIVGLAIRFKGRLRSLLPGSRRAGPLADPDSISGEPIGTNPGA